MCNLNFCYISSPVCAMSPGTGSVLVDLDQGEMARFAEDLPIQRVATMFVGLRREKHRTHLKYKRTCQASFLHSFVETHLK